MAIKASQPAQRILCVEGYEDICEMTSTLLRCSGYQVTTATTINRGLRLASRDRFALIILGSYYEDGTGIELCKLIRNSDPDTPILFYSGLARKCEIQEAINAGAQGYIIMPEVESLAPAISRLIRQAA